MSSFIRRYSGDHKCRRNWTPNHTILYYSSPQRLSVPNDCFFFFVFFFLIRTFSWSSECLVSCFSPQYSYWNLSLPLSLSLSLSLPPSPCGHSSEGEAFELYLTSPQTDDQREGRTSTKIKTSIVQN